MSGLKRWPTKIVALHVFEGGDHNEVHGQVTFSDGRTYHFSATRSITDFFVKDRNGFWRRFFSSEREWLVKDWLHDAGYFPERQSQQANEAEPISVYGC